MTYNDLQTTTKKIKDGETLTPTKIQRTRDICQQYISNLIQTTLIKVKLLADSVWVYRKYKHIIFITSGRFQGCVQDSLILNNKLYWKTDIFLFQMALNKYIFVLFTLLC